MTGNTSGKSLDQLVAEMIRQDEERGLTPLGSRSPQATMVGLGTKLGEFQKKLARRREEALASFEGDCIHCLDAPVPCTYCERGIAQIHTEAENHKILELAAWAEKVNIPRAYRKFTLESFPDQSVVRYFKENPLEKGKWLLLHGMTGVGKTGILLSLMKHRAELQYIMQRRIEPMIFTTSIDLLNTIKATYGEKTESTDRVLHRYRSTGLLVIDDLGAERGTDWTDEQLFAVLNERYANEQPVWISTNLEPVTPTTSPLAQHVGDRLFWRIYERARIVKLDGPNLRKNGGHHAD